MAPLHPPIRLDDAESIRSGRLARCIQQDAENINRIWYKIQRYICIFPYRLIQDSDGEIT